MSDTKLQARAELEALGPRLAALLADRPPFGPAENDADLLRHLSAALGAGAPALFEDHVGWAKARLASLGIPGADLVAGLQALSEVLALELDEHAAAAVAPHLERALRRLPELPTEPPSVLDGAGPTTGLARRYLDALLRWERRAASEMILEAVESGVPVRDVYLGVFEPVLREVGRLWQANRITVAQEHACTAATQLVMSQLFPRFLASEASGRKAVVACVSGDLHEIGARMVADFLELSGWDSCYLGASTPTDGVIRTVVDRSAELLAVSATMTCHVPAVAEIVEALRSHPSCADVRILVGGHPFRVDHDLWRKVGADATAPDAEQATVVAEGLVSETR